MEEGTARRTPPPTEALTGNHQAELAGAAPFVANNTGSLRHDYGVFAMVLAP
jgi:hypothetical protein